MKLKRLYLLLPIASMFFAFYLVIEVIPFGDRPFMYWWDVPAAITLALFVSAVSVISIIKATRD